MTLMKTTIKQLRQIIKEEISKLAPKSFAAFALELWKEAKTGEYLDSLTLEENLCNALDLDYEEITAIDEKYDMLSQACTSINDLYEKAIKDIKGAPISGGKQRLGVLYAPFRDNVDQIMNQLNQDLQLPN